MVPNGHRPLFLGRSLPQTIGASYVGASQTRVGFILDKRRSEYQCRALTRILDLFAEDSRRNVYADELEVRPPGAPTTRGLGHVP
jgi:hypothetical protein